MAIAIFDFDGTIISRDSLPDFLIQTCGWKDFLLRLPWIILLKGAALTGILSTHRAKELVISSFLRGLKTEDFQQACFKYASRIPTLIYPAALKEIRKHQKEGNKIAIISASIPDWIRPWAETVGIRLVEGTELEIKGETLTGRFSTPNCKGGEKVRRLRKLFPEFINETLYVYGDSSGDKELLALANVPHYKPFNNKQTDI